MTRRILRFGLFTMLGAIVVIVPPASAQEYRGQINGKVIDPSGAVIPGAQITLTHVASNTSSSVLANDVGTFTAFYLIPGQYTATVEAPGFKKLVRQGIEVRVGDQLDLSFSLELGQAAEVVTVSAEAPLLETSTASAGQVIDQRRISELPLSDGNPFTLHRLAPGVAYTGDLKFSRPFDNNGTSAVVVDGAPGGNEFTLDGSPNTDRRRVAFVPPSDVVQEFKVETANFDASDGHSGGGNVNVMLKSGSNRLHGTLYEFVRNDKLSANDFFLNRGNRPRAPLRYNRYGGTVGGPIWLPKLYDGHDRTFFFFGYEAIKDQFPEPGQFTVPTAAQRNGDFSALLALGSNFQIYDPTTAVREGSRIRRQPFAGNVIPASRISAISKKYLEFYPLPNQAGDAQGRNNFLGPNGRGDDFHSETYRFDHVLTSKQRVFFRYTHNSRRENRGNWSGVTGGIRATGNFLFRINHGGTWDHVYTLSPTTVLNYRVGFSRFVEADIRQHQGEFDAKTLGFSQAVTSLWEASDYFPRFDIGGFSALGDSRGGIRGHNIYSFQPTLSKVFGGGRHIVRTGYDLRVVRDNSYGSAHTAGQYSFGNTYTRGPLDNSTAAPIGQDLAAFVLGQTTGGSIPRNASAAYQTIYHAMFVQDDWKVTSRLTLNLGVRYELESGMTERYDRNIRGFDETSPNPIEADAKAAYARNPIADIPAADFKVRGGYRFLDSNNSSIWEPDNNNIQPRAGFAYRIGEKTVVRGGWGMYMIPFIFDGNRQDGFSQSTNIVPSLDSGLTFVANLANPWPNGVQTPPGSSLGLQTFLGRDLNFVPTSRRNGLTQRWEIGVQRELAGGWLLEAAYVGNSAYDLTVDSDISNAVPAKYLSTSPERDQTTINYLSAIVTNPFRGLFDPGTSLGSSANTSRGQLLRPYPHFGGTIRGRRNDASSRYHSAQFKLEKRFSRGYTLLASYTASQLMQSASFLNATDTQFEERISSDDRPHRIVTSGIWELPFGRGRRWGSGMHPVLNHILGGWQGTGIFQYQVAQPLNFDDQYIFRGDRNTVVLSRSERTIDRWFDTSGFERDSTRQLGSNIRTAPRQFPGLRAQPLNLWDLSMIKNFSITEDVKFQMRFEFLNAFNHAQFNQPNRTPTNSNFGRSTQQDNLPRNIQIGLKLLF